MTDVWTKRSDGSTVWGIRDDDGSSIPLIGWGTWTTATRPNPALYAGMLGYNTDFSGFEYWSGTKWKITSGTWTTYTRPVTTNLASGSRGFNTDEGIGSEEWNGTEWGKL